MTQEEKTGLWRVWQVRQVLAGVLMATFGIFQILFSMLLLMVMGGTFAISLSNYDTLKLVEEFAGDAILLVLLSVFLASLCLLVASKCLRLQRTPIGSIFGGGLLCFGIAKLHHGISIPILPYVYVFIGLCFCVWAYRARQ
ncbi:MAG: hypothetical protein AAGD07_18970 [Planctomycetota bacterium]